jgi:cytochrome b subunit of formate dehydrogenase
MSRAILSHEIPLTAFTSLLSTALCICIPTLPMFGGTSFHGRLHVMMAETVAGAAARSHHNRANLTDVATLRAGHLCTTKLTEITTMSPGEF